MERGAPTLNQIASAITLTVTSQSWIEKTEQKMKKKKENIDSDIGLRATAPMD